MSDQVEVEASQQIQQEQDYPEDQYYYNDDDYYDVGGLALQAQHSKDQPYSIYQLEELIKKIWEEIGQKAALCCMSDGWTLMLYYFANFNSSYFDDLLDQDNTGRNIIKYNQAYHPTTKEGECGVCLTETQLLLNPCGHGFCRDCWKYHIGVSHNDRNVYELFPLCQQEGCYHRTNYHLMAALWHDDAAMRTAFERLLCLKYSQQSIRVKLCSNQSCGKAIYMNSVIESTVVCQCGTEVCRHCGAEGHWPLQCSDLRNWNSMVSGREDQWINGLVTQKCPMCKETIEKNNGCIHMTCVCKYQFCWICLKVWKGHTNYYACLDLSRDDHEKKLKEEQAKRKLDENLYSQRLEEARGETERLTLSIKRVANTPLDGLVKRLEEAQVLAIHSDLLEEMRTFIKKAWGLVYRSSICHFFERDDSIDLRRVIYRINRAANEMDDFLAETLREKFKELDERIAKRIGNKEGSEREITESERLNLKFYFMGQKEMFSFKMREGMKVMEHIKRGEVETALSDLTSKTNPLYVQKQPLELLGKERESEMEVQADSSS